MSTNSITHNSNDTTIATGAKVLIQGLNKAPQYNFCIGTVVDHQHTQGRFNVRLHSNSKKTLVVKQENLTVVPNTETPNSDLFVEFINLAHEVGQGQGKIKLEVEMLESLEEVNDISHTRTVMMQPVIFVSLYDCYACHLRNCDKGFEYLAKAAQALNHPHLQDFTPDLTSIELLVRHGFGLLVEHFLADVTDVGQLEKTRQVMKNIISLVERVSRDVVPYDLRADTYNSYACVFQKMAKFMEAAEMYKKADEYMQMHAPGERHIKALLILPEMFMFEAIAKNHPKAKRKELFFGGIAEAQNLLKIATKLDDEHVYKAKTVLAYLMCKAFQLRLVVQTNENCQEVLALAEEGLQGAIAKNDQVAIEQAQQILGNLKLAER